MTGFDGAGSLSLLLDVIPLAALVLLGLDFLRSRHRMKAEERRLKAALEDFRRAERNTDGCDN